MKIVEQCHKITNIDENALRQIEKAARTCYKSEGKIGPGSAHKITSMLLSKGHEAMIEFGDMTVWFLTDRGVTHELVRHRMCSFAQESTRYVKYGKDMEFVLPVWAKEWDEDCQARWAHSCIQDVENYTYLIDRGARPEQARSVLPNSLKTEINVKANFREWRHIFAMRCQKAAHPQIRALMLPLLAEVIEHVPVVFDDLGEKFLPMFGGK